MGSDQAAWVFVGSGQPRGMTGRPLTSRVPLGRRMRLAAEALRQPYLDFLQDVEQLQASSPAWHGSTLAWRDPEASDLFLVLCQLWAVRDLLNSTPAEAFQVVAGDAWIAEACRVSGIAPGRISVAPHAGRLTVLVRGLGSRLRWGLQMALHWWKFRAFDRAPSRAPEVWLYSLLHPRCLQGENGWRDPFMGELSGLLRENGAQVGRLLPLAHIGDVATLVTRMDYLRPLARGISLSGLCKALFSLWMPRWPRSARVEGLDVSSLLRRAWWQDLGRAVGPAASLFEDSMARMFRQREVSCVVFPYENQPWERMLILAASAAGVRTVGYQHSTVPRLSLNYFFGKSGVGVAPMPDLVLTAGRHQRESLVAGGLPEERVKVGGAWRYQHLSGPLKDPPSVERSPRRVLVVTAHQLDAVQELDGALRRSFPDGGEADSIEFWFRPHPTILQSASGTGDWMPTLMGELAHQLLDFDAAICVGTTVAIEAFLVGLPVLRFLPEVAVDLDPADVIPERNVPAVDAESLRSELFRILEHPTPATSDSRTGWREALFPTVKEDVWVESVLPGF